MERKNNIELGECFTLKHKSIFISIIVIEANHLDGEYSITPIINEFTEKPNIDEIINSDILAQQYSDTSIPNGKKGLLAIHLLFEREFIELRERFEFVGQIELDESQIGIGGGSTLRENIPYEENFIIPLSSPDFIKMTRVKIGNIIRK